MNPRRLIIDDLHGYAMSYSAGTMEGGLTTCVEAIERLLEAFEQASGLSREVIDRKRWKKLAKEIRRQAAPLLEIRSDREAMQRALGGVPMMHLLERLNRMIKAMPRKSRELPNELLQGAHAMINARNSIVHGRIVDNYNILRIELLRAQSLFERLWLGFMNCGDLDSPGWAINAVRMHDAQTAITPTS